MTVPAILSSTRGRVVMVAALGVALMLVWRAIAPPAVSAPKSIESLPRHDNGYWFDIAQRVRDGAAEDPRLGTTAAAVYGPSSQPTPTLGVLAAVIKIGHGGDIVTSLANGLAGGGVTLGTRESAPAGKHGGTFECGAAAFGADSGTYCVWWTADAVGLAVVTGLDPTAARRLALSARNATHR